MMYRSTEGRAPETTFRSALLSGLAPDGGLYVPKDIPLLPTELVQRFASFPLHSIGTEILSLFIDDITREELHEILGQVWTFPIPLIHLEHNLYLLELFHGPTLAFKDVGARFLARTLAHYLRTSDQHTAIAVATSGDTGSAVAHGFHTVPRTTVYVLYPSGRISPLQEQQITTLGKNVHALEIAGTFDDCQRLVKQALRDTELVRVCNLTTANSINLGRLIPQIAYFVWGVAQWEREYRTGTQQRAPMFVVPSGNFGNLTAGVYARALGAPIERFVAATNVNDSGGIYLRTGSFASCSVRQTYSNAMDVGNPSNLARLRSYFHDDVAAIQRSIGTFRVTDDETLKEMRLTFERTGKVVDPHTAVGLAAARKEPGDSPIIVAATAHPGKFPDIVERALGVRIPLPPQLQEAFHRPRHSVRLPAEYTAVKRYMVHDQ